MLVLTRRANQSIMIGDDIVVTVLEVKGDQIRLGIDAPRSVQVFREEVLMALQEANRSAVLEPGAAPAVPTSPGRPGPGGGRSLPATGTAPASPSSLSSTPRPRAVPKPPTPRPVSQLAGPRSAA